ncbi:MAG TPA: M48 family metalloprotease [Pyrinomonadaceae bacterium]|nr:M48 family metalloprotease [Pyrinomonadaceae bacterium]
MKANKFKATARILAGIVFLSLMLPVFALGQKDDKSKQDKKETKQNEKDEKRVEKQVQKYQETLNKAQEKYTKEAEFKEEVDYEYRRLQREHAKLAFEFNTLDNNDWVTTNSGDKLPKNNDTLYDNLMAQDYVNRVGQSLVPVNSDKRYGFKITVNPMPDARSLSTGTVYVSTGLLSLVDNEAQLAYILSHEISHIERDHWKQDVLVAKWVEEATKAQERRGSIFGAIAGGVTGGLLGGDMFRMAMFGAAIGKSVAKLVDRKAFEWSLAQEDEADRLGMEYMLHRNYDVRETQVFYETLKVTALEDPRLELDRFADRQRTEERRKYINGWINTVDSSLLAKTTFGATNLNGKSLSLDRNANVTIDRMKRNQEKMADDVKLKVQNGDIQAGDGEFENIMAILKRDNGIVAFYYDMYKLSARNLSQSLAIRSDDALGYFYYGKVLKQTARKPGEKEQALVMFDKAIQLDRRGANPQARLYYALTKMSGRTTNNIAEITNDLKQYVGLYQQVNGGSLPPNMSIIYDFMQEAGETNWNAVPVANVKNVAVNTPAIPSANPPATVTNQPTTTRKKP